MHALAKAISSVLVIALPIMAASAAEPGTCPSTSAIKAKTGTCGVGYEGCQYEVQAAGGITWKGSDPEDTAKNGDVPAKFLEATARQDAQSGRTELFCDYGFLDTQGNLLKTGGVRLTPEPAKKVTLTNGWSSAEGASSVCKGEDPTKCTFTVVN